jgi:hypothetical protein
MHLHYSCRDPSTGAPSHGGDLVLRHRKRVPIDYYGYLPYFHPRLQVPGVSGRVATEVWGHFEWHHRIPPAPTRGRIYLSAPPFTKASGNVCRVGRHGSYTWRVHRR